MSARLLLPALIGLLCVSTTVSNSNKIDSWWSKVSTSYLKYADLKKLLEEMQSAYPKLVKYYSIGKTVQNREMFVINLRKDVKEPRKSLQPQMKIVANMHGDETVGRVVTLALAVDLLKKYVADDPRAVEILSTIDIHLMPSANPDGFEASEEGECSPVPGQLGRNNANNEDLNRNFPRKNAKTEGREPETVNLMKWITSNYFVSSLNLHGGAVVVCYPYDYVSPTGNAHTPDNDVFYYQSKLYARNHKTLPTDTDQCGFSFPDEGVINAAAWYPLAGGMQDFNYLRSNTFEMTVELSCCKYPPAYDILPEWENNKESLYKYIESVHMGIRGYVFDLVGDTIEGAEVLVQGRNHPIKSNDRGEYWRLLVPGKYKVAARKGDTQLKWVEVDVKEPKNDKWRPIIVNLTIPEELD